jgi:hypothetical protein
MEITFYLIVFCAFLSIVTNVVLFIHIRSMKLINTDMANAFQKMMQYFEREFEINLRTHEKMQQWNENNLQIIIDKCDMAEADHKYTHQFLSRIAQGLGLQRSNLEDL